MKSNQDILTPLYLFSYLSKIHDPDLPQGPCFLQSVPGSVPRRDRLRRSADPDGNNGHPVCGTIFMWHCLAPAGREARTMTAGMLCCVSLVTGDEALNQ